MWKERLGFSCQLVFLVAMLPVPVFGVGPRFDEPYTNVTVHEKETAVLPCAVDNLWKFKVVWSDQWSTLLTLDERRIIDDDRISIERPYSRDWNLHIRRVEYKDRGEYTCQVNTNPVRSKKVMLNVLVPSKIINEFSSRDKTVQVGDTVTFVCNVTGVPMPEVTWYKLSAEGAVQTKQRLSAAPGTHTTIDSCAYTLKQTEMLVIHNVSRYCDGVYECVAYNNVGPRAARQIQVSVEFAPEVALPNRRIGQLMGKDTILVCEITAYPHAVMYWMKQDREISHSTKYRIDLTNRDKDHTNRNTVTLSLRIINIEPEDYGEYSCLAQNSIGQEKKTMVLYEYGTTCPPNMMKCEKTQKCIGLSWVCDGDFDCGEDDRSDEVNCGTRTCASDEMQCLDGDCVSTRWVCDAEKDCKDGSDEANCTSPRTCSEGEYMCKDQQTCISKAWLCDGSMDCKDGDDEFACSKNKSCGDMFTCKSDQKCINKQWKCDGDTDCSDGSDEEDCGDMKKCQSDEFQCADNARCIDRKWFCDGDIDCVDQSDEANCNGTSSNTTLCRDQEFLCKSEDQCIHSSWVCDGVRECSDGSDEIQCDYTCRDDQFVCTNGSQTPYQCLNITLVCDGTADCVDQSDEKGCPEGPVMPKSPPTGLKATVLSAHTIVLTWTDSSLGKTQRINDSRYYTVRYNSVPARSRNKFVNSTDLNCHIDDLRPNTLYQFSVKVVIGGRQTTWSMSVTNKTQESIPGSMPRDLTPVPVEGDPLAVTLSWEPPQKSNGQITGYLVFYTTDPNQDVRNWVVEGVLGEKLSVTVTDLTEDTSYYFKIQARNRKGYGPMSATVIYKIPNSKDEETWLYFATRQNIRRVSTDTRVMEIVVENIKNTVTFDIDFSGGLLFWVDLVDNVINSGQIGTNGTVMAAGRTQVLKYRGLGNFMVAGLAVDWLHKNLYWTNSEDDTITVSNYLGNKTKILVKRNLDEPRAICVDPEEGFMYWTDWGDNHRIEKAGMEGSDRKVLVQGNNDVVWPNGLTIDYVARRLYWIDAKLKKIGSARLDGSGVFTVLRDPNIINHPFSITMFKNTLYFTDWRNNAIRSVNKITGQNVTTVASGLNHLMDIKVYHKKRQSLTHAAETAALCAPCNGLCVAKPQVPGTARNVECICDNGWCASAPPTIDKKALLLFANRKTIYRYGIDSREGEIFIDNVGNSVALDFDYKQRMLFWTNLQDDVISSVKLDAYGRRSAGAEITQVYRKNENSTFTVEGLAVDWLHKNLYWTNTGDKTINVANYNGSITKILINKGLDEPRAICVDPEHGYMYWTDWGDNARIEKAGMDASVRAVLVDGLDWVNGITIDYGAGRLYWVDAKQDKIGSVRTDGSGVTTVCDQSVLHPFGITVFKDTLYYTDWRSSSINIVNKVTGQHGGKFASELTNLMDVKVYHETIQNQTLVAETAALCSGCTGLCLAKPQVPGAAREVTCLCVGDRCATTPFTSAQTTATAASSVSMETSTAPSRIITTTAANQNNKEETCTDKGLFDCHNDSSLCIPYLKVCDRKTDCSHGDDEEPALCRQIMLARLYHAMREIKARGDRQQALLAEIKKIASRGRQTNAPMPDWTRLPIQTPEQFDDLEKMLSNSEASSTLVKRLTTSAAGSSVEVMVTKAMEGLVSSNLVSSSRWRASMIIAGFRQTKLYAALSRATRKVFPGVLNTDIETVLEGWLTRT